MVARGGGGVEKNNVKIGIPVEGLEVAGEEYRLFGVVHHEGFGQGEHFSAEAENFANEGEWLRYGESCQRLNIGDEIVSNTAVLLFYSKLNN